MTTKRLKHPILLFGGFLEIVDSHENLDEMNALLHQWIRTSFENNMEFSSWLDTHLSYQEMNTLIYSDTATCKEVNRVLYNLYEIMNDSIEKFLNFDWRSE